MIQIPDQRVAESKKRTDVTWYRTNADAIIDLAISSNDKQLTIDCMKAANGEIDKKDYAYVLSTYMETGESSKVEKDLDINRLGKLRDVDILTPIKDKYMGEFINSYHNYQVYSLDPDVIFKRNSEIGTKVVELMFKKLQQILSSQDDPNSNIDIKSFIDKELEDWKDDTVIKEQSSLEMLNAIIDAKRKYVDAYFYWWACEEVYTYRRIIGKDVKFDIIDPREYYRVDSGNYFVEDDHYGLRRYSMTLEEIISEFYNNMEDGLTEKQLEFIKAYIKQFNTGQQVTSAIFLEYRDAFPQYIKNGDFPSGSSFTKDGLTTTVDHYVFTTEIKTGILKYISPDGEESEMPVSEDYKLEPEGGDISIDWKWSSQKWEGWIFGGDGNVKMYIPPRPIQLERELLSNVNVCKSPYNGISYIHVSSKKKPIPIRIKDYIVLYKIYTLLEEKWINKFKSWLITPESIISDTTEMSTEDRFQQADIDSIFPFNDAAMQSNPNAMSMFREVATTSVIEYIKVLNEVKQSIKADAWELANMNDARFGSNSQYKGKAVTEYDYNQAIKGTVWSLEMFNSFREKDYMANLDYSRAAWVDGKQGSFVDPNTKEITYVDIDGLSHLGANVGIYIMNSAELNAQAESLKQLAFSLGQNDDPATAAEALTNKNISKLKELVVTAAKAKKAFELQIQTVKENINQQTEQIKIQDNQAQRDHDIQLAREAHDSAYEIAILNNETLISINEAKLQVDTNGNGYIDKNEQDAAAGSLGDIAAKDEAKSILDRRKQGLNELKAGAAIKKANQTTQH